MSPSEIEQLSLEDADHAASFAWRAVADDVIRELAADGRPFTAETWRARVNERIESGDVDAIGLADAHPNAIGARFSAARRRGEIVCIGAVNAERKAAAGRLLRQWIGT